MNTPVADIRLYFKDFTSVVVTGEPSTLREIHDLFEFYAPNFKFNPKFKAKIWNGKISLFNMMTQTLPLGLLSRLFRWAKSQNYSVELDEPLKQAIMPDDTLKRLGGAAAFYKQLKLPFEPHDFQINALTLAAKFKRRAIISSTGSGKSLIVYALARYIDEAFDIAPILILVPNISLVNQIESDFAGYGKQDASWNSNRLHKIYGGQDKHFSAETKIVVSTWQSLMDISPDWFTQFKAVIVDEVHQAKAHQLSKMVRLCTHAEFKIGFTGTLNENECDAATIEGIFGPPERVSTSADLMERGILAKLKVVNCVLKYAKHECIPRDYQAEIDFIGEHSPRLDFIVNLAERQSQAGKNTLILVNHVDHGRLLTAALEAKGLSAVFISGQMQALEREMERKKTETLSGRNIVATFGVFSTGINIVKLDVMIFASPSKSKIRVLQSIGRSLRTGTTKQTATVFDVIDDLRGGKAKANHLYRQWADDRQRYYSDENFDVHTVELDLKPEVMP